ncbi:hypothetical protein BO79DRAFT_140396 [Aspergillus costaricaensis CBS 115574]|uniref:Uncharacterized protein n=1 Tax=Aspergillus costaricaensis CBS 115574 TaxID=1448317 RepID=A0ACD1IMZ5_9EURO|nr:hypothetical protein BO79DRAFT_140396 [Aspergillus costaricaensis CBS 115574]RAK91858.1 hypothetical protein BO79DRAFT_140396 [Aspergillus costaricaensis CBS 115574]
MSKSYQDLGLWNLRNVGGYHVSPHRCMRKDLIYRSANLDSIGHPGAHILQSQLGIKIIFDLRSTVEHIRPKVLLDGAVVSLPALANPDPETLQTYFEGISKSPAESVARLYIHTVNNSVKCFRAIFEYIRDNPSCPVLVHCELGKDRTGVFISLLLFVLGVCETDIIYDYTLSQDEIKDIIHERKAKLFKTAFMDGISVSPIALENHFKALPGSMKLFLSYLRETYRDGRGYLSSLGFSDVDYATIYNNLTVNL